MKNYRLTPEELESMTTHELAELLAAVVLLLRRLPNVPFRELSESSAQAIESKGEVTE